MIVGLENICGCFWLLVLLGMVIVAIILAKIMGDEM